MSTQPVGSAVEKDAEGIAPTSAGGLLCSRSPRGPPSESPDLDPQPRAGAPSPSRAQLELPARAGIHTADLASRRTAARALAEAPSPGLRRKPPHSRHVRTPGVEANTFAVRVVSPRLPSCPAARASHRRRSTGHARATGRASRARRAGRSLPRTSSGPNGGSPGGVGPPTPAPAALPRGRGRCPVPLETRRCGRFWPFASLDRAGRRGTVARS